MERQKQDRIRFRVRLAELDMNITQLAQAVGHPRESVSRAINQGRYPRIVAKVKGVLGV